MLGKFPREAQDEMRRQAMRTRAELKLPWKEIARVVGVNINTVIGWSKRYSMEGESGLKSKIRGRRYLSGRTRTLAQEWQLRSIINHPGCRRPCPIQLKSSAAGSTHSRKGF